MEGPRAVPNPGRRREFGEVGPGLRSRERGCFIRATFPYGIGMSWTFFGMS